MKPEGFRDGIVGQAMLGSKRMKKHGKPWRSVQGRGVSSGLTEEIPWGEPNGGYRNLEA
jgi:hypothetical protein